MPHGLYNTSTLEPFIERGFTVLTPNLRLSRRIKAQWDSSQEAAGKTVWQALAVQPLEQWLLAQWEEAVRLNLLPALVPLSETQELAIWRQVIEQHSQQAGGFTLLRDSAAAELASGARDTLMRWGLQLKEPAIRQRFQLEQDCETFVQWLSLFDKRLAANGHCTRAQCLVALAEVGQQLAPSQIVLAEIEELAPLTQRCLSALTSRLERHSAGGPETEPTVHAYTDGRAELQGIASWAAQLHRQDSGSTIGIVLSGDSQQRTGIEYLLRREFDCLGENYNSLPVNFSTGISLGQAPVVRDALAALSTGLLRISVATVASLLQSRFLELPDRHSAVAQYFLGELYRGGSVDLPVSELRNFANTVKRGEQVGLLLGARLLDMFTLRELRETAKVSVWVERFATVLDCWGWPGAAPLDSLEYQQVTRWYQTLDELRSMDAVYPPLDYSSALAILGEVCGKQVSHPQTADSPVQVLGPLEAVGLSFDHLWICGMQVSNWPASPRPNPFIPVSIQTLRQMPHATAEREWTFARTLLTQYQRANGSLQASYSKQKDGIADLPSPLLAGLAESESEEPFAIDPRWYAQQENVHWEFAEDEQAPAMDDAQLIAVRGGAALLEHQSHCPFRAFARHRLRVDSMPEFGAGLNAAERGNMVHEALRVLWEELHDHAALVQLGVADRLAAVKRAAAIAITTPPGFRRRALGAACLELEAKRLQALLLEWLEVECQRGEFAIAALESAVELTLSKLTVRLRVDRIDRLADNSTVIIDYKTGKAKAADWFGERPAKPQLLLYGLASDQLPAALAFAQLRPGESAYVGVGVVDAIPGVKTDIAKAAGEEAGVADWAALNARWRDQLNMLANEFVTGVAKVDPLTGNSCTYCGLQPLCRIDVDSVTDSVKTQEETL